MYKYLLIITLFLFINNSFAIKFNFGKSQKELPTSSTKSPLTFHSYHLDHFDNNNTQYNSIINFLKSDNHNIIIHNSNNIKQFNNNNNNKNNIAIGSSKLLKDFSLIKYHVAKRNPIVLVNVNNEEKKNFCSLVDGCIDGQHSNVLAYIPKVTNNGLEYIKTFHWVNESTFDNINSTTLEFDGIGSSDSYSHYSNITENQDINQVSNILDLMVDNLRGSVNDDGPSAPLIPPSNSTIPFKYLETTIAKSFLTKLDQSLVGKVQQQTFSFSINNQVYFYKDIPNKCIYSLFYQNGYMFPDSKLGINSPKNAIGSFTTSFGISNTPTINSNVPNYKLFSIQSSSPQTVDQKHTETSTVTTEMSIGVSFDITPDGPSGGASFSDSWSSSHTVSNDISDYGVNEMTDPYSMVSSWVYHQQYPFDVYTSGVNNFDQWFGQAYQSNGNVAPPPSLSTSTLQTATSWKWKSSLDLIDSNNQLNVQVNHHVDLSYCLVQSPSFLSQDKHHRLYYNNPKFSFNLNYNFNNFN